MYILYGGRFTGSLLVEMVMAEGDIAYELREINISKKEHRLQAHVVHPVMGFAEEGEVVAVGELPSLW